MTEATLWVDGMTFRHYRKSFDVPYIAIDACLLQNLIFNYTLHNFTIKEYMVAF